MKALTLHQPWASLVALGVKTIETRSWSTSYRGPLAIHAAKRRMREDDFQVGVHDFDGDFHRAGTCIVDLPFGAVVATCTLTDVVPILGAGWRLDEAWAKHVAESREGDDLWLWLGPSDTENLSTGRPTWRHEVIEEQRAYGDYTPGRYAWLLEDIERIEPVPAKGHQHLWTWSA